MPTAASTGTQELEGEGEGPCRDKYKGNSGIPLFWNLTTSEETRKASALPQRPVIYSCVVTIQLAASLSIRIASIHQSTLVFPL